VKYQHPETVSCYVDISFKNFVDTRFICCLVMRHIHRKLGQMTSKWRRYKFRHLSWITRRYDSQIDHYFVSTNWSLLLQAFYSIFKNLCFFFACAPDYSFNWFRIGRQQISQHFCKKIKSPDFFWIQLKRNYSCDKSIIVTNFLQ
jgi:hypothetical protein